VLRQRTVLEERMYWLKRAAEAMKEVVAPPELEDVQSLKQQLHQQAVLAAQLRQSCETSKTLAVLVEPPQTENVQPLSGLIRQLQSVRDGLKQVEQRAGAMTRLVDPPQLFDDAPLRSVVGMMNDLVQRKGKAEQGLLALEQEMADFEAALKARLNDMGCCPTCGGELDAEEFLAGGCSHGT